VGIVTGCLLWAAAVAVGLGALLVASRFAYDVLRWIGAGYLFYVGLKLLLRPRAQFDLDGSRNGRAGHAYARGALTNLLNPKVGVFYVTFLPQFVPDGVSIVPYTMLLGAIHAFLGLLWLSILVAATSAIGQWLRKARVVRALDRLTGSVFIAFGLRLAADSRGA
jgi:threonine/homoserine/homoserine lactone efflux protein